MKKTFHGGAFFETIGTDFNDLNKAKNIISADVLDAWFKPTSKAILKLKKYLSFSLKTSPPIYADGLIKVISKTRNIPINNILISGGSSDIMFSLFPNINPQIKKIIILDPMYGEYSYIFENLLKKTIIIEYKLLAEKDFKLDIQDFSNFINSIKPELVVIVNPNNPTAQFIEKNKIKLLLSKISKQTMLVVDEAYIDFVDSSQSVETIAPLRKNLIVIKSMSKVYALSGARVAYMVANKSIIDQISSFIPPWSVSLPAQITSIEALKDQKYYKEKWETTKKNRDSFINKLNKLPNVKIYSSVTNFVLIELRNKNKGRAKEIVTDLAKENIFIRNPDSMSKQFNGNFLRIAIKNHRENNTVIHKLKNKLS